MDETFYGGFYNLNSPPFHITPDPALLFATETHQQALGVVEYGIAAGKGFIVVTGEVGVGKTTILRSVLDRLDSRKTKILYLFNPDLTVAELNTAILEGLDAPAGPTRDPGETLQALQHALLDMHRRGIQVILAVDEAQNMPEATLESMRVLSNLETATSKLLQIILVGQPELEATLRKHSLRQLAQRIAVRANIAPLTFRQSCRYITHRLICAGRPTEPPLFTTPALWWMAWTGRGIPRTLNICADNALINGYGHRAERIKLGLVRQSIRALQPKRRPPKRTAAWRTVAALLMAVLGGDLLLRGLPQRPVPPPASPATIPAPAPTVATESAPTPLPLDVEPSLSSVLSPASAAAPAAMAPNPPVQAPKPAMPASVTAIPAANTVSAPPPPQPVAKNSTEAYTHWVVQPGDTLTRACRETYGTCNPQDMREIFAYNPKIDAKGSIRAGDIIMLPNKGVAPKPN